MIRGLRRVLIFLLFAVLMQLQVSAQSSSAYTVKELNVRVNNAGAQISAEITGTPGSWVSVELMYPDTEIGQVYSAAEETDVLAGIDMLQLSESGDAVYEYTAKEQTGVYTLRVSGAVESVDYTSADNELTEAESDVFFAEMWTSAYSDVYDDYVQGAVWLKKNMLSNMENAATQIKEQLDTREPGRRYLFIDADISNIPENNSGTFIWKWEPVEEQAALLDEFFSIYYDIGGQLDGIYTDCEAEMSNWGINVIPGGEERDTYIDSIIAEPLYSEKIRPLLAERGFVFNTEEGKNEIYDVAYYNNAKGTEAEANYLIWNAVMDNYKSECLNAGIYQPAAKYFPHVKYSNYQSSDRYAGNYYSSSHKYYLGGNKIKAGTHSSPVLYNSSTGGTSYAPDGSSYTTEQTAFVETCGLVNGMRTALQSNDNGKIMPWVTAKYANKAFTQITGDYLPYYYEYFLHVTMCNPDALLFYGPAYDATTTAEQISENISGLYEVMEEINTYADRKGAEPLITNRVSASERYILSGIKTRDRYLWRITPDVTVLTDTANFCVSSGETPEFYIDGTAIKFPQGKILDNLYSAYGYWIETPLGVYPVAEYDEVPDTCEITIKRYDDNGMELSQDDKIGDIDSVAIFYNGNLEYVDGINMNVVKYGDSSMEEIGNPANPIGAGFSGSLFFRNLDGDGDEKLFIWESLDNLKPITPALPWNGR